MLRIGFVLLILAPTVALAGHRHHCGAFFVAPVVHHHGYVQKAAFAVGDHVRDNAIAEYAADRAVKKTIAAFQSGQLQLNAPQALQQTASALLTQRCGSCHNGSKAFDIRDGLSPEQYVTFSKMAGLGEFPAGTEAMKPVIARLQSDGKLGDVIAELLRTPYAAGPAPVAKPDEGGLE